MTRIIIRTYEECNAVTDNVITAACLRLTLEQNDGNPIWYEPLEPGEARRPMRCGKLPPQSSDDRRKTNLKRMKKYAAELPEAEPAADEYAPTHAASVLTGLGALTVIAAIIIATLIPVIYMLYIWHTTVPVPAGW